MRREDAGAITLAVVRQPLAQRLELEMRGRDRRIERTTLGIRIGPAFPRHLVVVTQMDDLPHRHPGGRGHASQGAIGRGTSRPRGGRARPGGPHDVRPHDAGPHDAGPNGPREARLPGARAGMPQESNERRHRLDRIDAACHDGDRIATAHFERHDRDEAAQIGFAFALLEPQIGGEALGSGRERGSGARVQSCGIGDGHRLGPNGRPEHRGIDLARGRPTAHRNSGDRRLLEPDPQHRVPPSLHPARRREHPLDEFHVGDDHRRDQADRPPPHHVRLEPQQRLTSLYELPRGDERPEPGSIELHRVEPHVDHDLQSPHVERDRMPGPVDLHHARIGWREHGVAQRVHGHAIADEPLTECFVRHRLQRNQHTRERRQQREHRWVGHAVDSAPQRPARMRIACPPPGAILIRRRDSASTGTCVMVSGNGLSRQSASGPSA